MSSTLSKSQKLLIAASRLAGMDGEAQFGAEDLVVEAFRLYPSDFCMKGYPQYPHSNAVFTNLMGKKSPLIGRGWLVKTGTNRYRLTPKGAHDVSELQSGADPDQAAIHVDRKLEEGLGQLLGSQVFEMYSEGNGEQVTFHQFCRFAGLSARDKWQKVAGKLSALDHLAAEARRIGEEGRTLRIHLRKRNSEYTPDALRSLFAAVNFLKKKFENEMKQWRAHAGV